MSDSADIPSRPALLGGTPIRPQGPPDWPGADDDVAKALQSVYSDGSWGKYHGAYVEKLEQRLAEYHDVPYALTCASGTFAVELGLRALHVGPGAEVILAAYDYPGNFLSVHAVGATPVLIDVAAGNWNLDPALFDEAISPTTRAVIVSHLHGGIVPMREVMESAARHGVNVIEDAAQMPGALVQERKAGTWGDIGVLSFGGSKLLSAGRGGAIITRNALFHQRSRLFQHRGNIVSPLSELQAAVLLPQLDKLDERNVQRRESVLRICEAMASVPGIRPFTNSCTGEAGYYKLGFQFDQGVFGLSRDNFLAACSAEGIALNEGFRGLHIGRSPARFRRFGNLAEAERAHYGTIVLHHPVLLGSAAEVDEVASAVKKVWANREQLNG